MKRCERGRCHPSPFSPFPPRGNDGLEPRHLFSGQGVLGWGCISVLSRMPCNFQFWKKHEELLFEPSHSPAARDLPVAIWPITAPRLGAQFCNNFSSVKFETLMTGRKGNRLIRFCSERNPVYYLQELQGRHFLSALNLQSAGHEVLQYVSGSQLNSVS